jgi:hypothetical protein
MNILNLCTLFRPNKNVQNQRIPFCGLDAFKLFYTETSDETLVQICRHGGHHINARTQKCSFTIEGRRFNGCTIEYLKKQKKKQKKNMKQGRFYA